MRISARTFRILVRAIGVSWVLSGLYVGSSVLLIPYERKVHALFAAVFLLIGVWLLIARSPWNLFDSQIRGRDGSP